MNCQDLFHIRELPGSFPSWRTVRTCSISENCQGLFHLRELWGPVPSWRTVRVFSILENCQSLFLRTDMAPAHRDLPMPIYLNILSPFYFEEVVCVLKSPIYFSRSRPIYSLLTKYVLRFWYNCIGGVMQASTLTYFSTCPFGQLTKKSTCPTQSFSCSKELIKITKTRE
jgi:hypothetical protein